LFKLEISLQLHQVFQGLIDPAEDLLLQYGVVEMELESFDIVLLVFVELDTDVDRGEIAFVLVK